MSEKSGWQQSAITPNYVVLLLADETNQAKQPFDAHMLIEAIAQRVVEKLDARALATSEKQP